MICRPVFLSGRGICGAFPLRGGLIRRPDPSREDAIRRTAPAAGRPIRRSAPLREGEVRRPVPLREGAVRGGTVGRGAKCRGGGRKSGGAFPRESWCRSRAGPAINLERPCSGPVARLATGLDDNRGLMESACILRTASSVRGFPRLPGAEEVVRRPGGAAVTGRIEGGVGTGRIGNRQGARQ